MLINRNLICSKIFIEIYIERYLPIYFPLYLWFKVKTSYWSNWNEFFFRNFDTITHQLWNIKSQLYLNNQYLNNTNDKKMIYKKN